MRSILTATVFFFFINSILNGQVAADTKVNPVTDSLSLKNIIERVITGHPSIKVAEEAINNANARIGLAKTGYYPQIVLEANYANLGPATKLNIPTLGSFQLYPANNYCIYKLQATCL
jgi:outer membrane protein TolC